MQPLNDPLNTLPVSISRNWGWLFVLGLFFVALGCVGLGMVVKLTIASIFILGLLVIAAGLAQIFDVFKSRDWQGVAWHALVAALYILSGALILYDPILASALITALLASVLILIGITRCTMGFVLRHTKGSVWFFLAGITSIILGILIFMQWPVSALWIIGLFISIELIMNGWTYVFIALSIRKH